MRHWVSIEDVNNIALGAALLGTGGGGNVRLGGLKLRHTLRQGAAVEVVSPDEIDDDDVGVAISGMGVPTIDVEKVPQGDEGTHAVRAVEQYLNRRFGFLVVGQVGGANALEALYVGAKMGLPVVDADPMGRAFPELEMDTFMINGVPAHPLGLADAHGTVAVLGDLTDPFRAERYARALTIAMGGSTALAMPVLTGSQMKRFGVLGSLTLARHLGGLMQKCPNLESLVGDLRGAGHAVHLLAQGKIADLERKTQGGFARGKIVLQDGALTHAVLLQNEFLVLLDGREQVVASVPDLITMVDRESGRPISTDQLRYGMRVAALGFPAPDQMKTDAALRVVGPAAFRYPFLYQPLSGRYPKAPWFDG